MKQVWLILIGSIFVNNLLLARFLGLCTLFCPGGKLREFLKAGTTLTAVIIVSSWLCRAVFCWFLLPLNLRFIQLPVFVLLNASLVYAAVMVLRKFSPRSYSVLGNYLLLFAAHCAVLGIVLVIMEQNGNFLQTTACALGSGIGGLAVMAIFSAVRESVRFAPVPRALKGGAIDFIVLSLMSLAFLGFLGFLGIY